ncbi:non-ribosomal peptide synthetase [Beggiatoa sp. PS]|nr:non-ribosomal peptide synthetase [Beggiatoa sp. PS]
MTELIQRHEILRTTFSTKDGIPFQVIAPKIPRVTLPIIDLHSSSENIQQNEVQRTIIEENQRSFDLINGPLLRLTLVRLSDIETKSGTLVPNYVFLLSIHHIIIDGWSMGIFIRELTTLYQAFSQNQPSPLPPLPIQYVDFAHWQRQKLQGEVLEQQVNYWQQQLSGIPELLELPTDHPRPPIQLFQGSIQYFEIKEELNQQLKQLSQQSGATLFMTLLTAFVTLLYRYTGQEDIVVGSPIANRHHRDIESLIGFFVNTLVLRACVAGNPHFLDLLEQVKQTSLDAYAHQDVPFEHLVEVLQPSRDLSYSPLFQVMFVLQNAPMAPLDCLNWK